MMFHDHNFTMIYSLNISVSYVIYNLFDKNLQYITAQKYPMPSYVKTYK